MAPRTDDTPFDGIDAWYNDLPSQDTGTPTHPFPILVAIDDDECTSAVLRVTEALETQRQASPSLLYVIALTPTAALDGGVGIANLTEELSNPARRARDAAALRITCHADTGRPAAWPFDVELGAAAPSIVAHARHRKANMVVMGLHHHTTVGRAIGRDTVHEVLLLGGVPVLAIRPELTALPRTIVVAMDFSRASVRSARLARRLMADDGTMYLAFVAPPPHAASEETEGDRLIAANGVAATFAQVEQLLDPGPQMRIVPIERAGDPIPVLQAIGEDVHPDLFVLGSQRHSAHHRLFVGSVARALATDGRWSVLITPPVLTE